MARLLAAVVAGLLGTATFPAPPPGQSPRAAVLIDAVAVGRDGLPVADLKPDDLEVWIGHFRVPVESLELVTSESETHGGRLVILLLDDITVPLPMIARVHDIAGRFVSRILPGDQMAVVMLSNPSLESSNDPARLRSAISRYSVRATGVMRSYELGEQVLNTVATIAQGLREAGDGRKIIVGIGSGWLFDRPIPPPSAGADILPAWVTAMRALSQSHAVFYAIDPGGVGTRADRGDTGFARETGGRAFVNTNDGRAAADAILRETGSYYLIGVGNPPVGGNGLRELELKSLRRGVTLRARRAIH